MSRIIMLLPTDSGIGLTSIRLGLSRVMKKKGIKLSVLKPIIKTPLKNTNINSITYFNPSYSHTPYNQPLDIKYIEYMLASNKKDSLMEEIFFCCQAESKKSEVVILEGFAASHKNSHFNSLNYEIARTLNAEIVFIVPIKTNILGQIVANIELLCLSFGGKQNRKIAGVIFNKLHLPFDRETLIQEDFLEIIHHTHKEKIKNIEPSLLYKYSPLPVLGYIPWNVDLIVMRAIDIACNIGATIIHDGDIQTRRVTSIKFCEKSLENMLEDFQSGSLLVISSDRLDILLAACLHAINGVKISGLLLTNVYDIDERIYQLCKQTFHTGLPIFTIQSNFREVFLTLQRLSLKVPDDDYSRLKKVKNHIADHIDKSWIKSLSSVSQPRNQLTPLEFRYHLTELARQSNKRIILPEGDEPRTVQAASICVERNIAHCILLGNVDKIQRVAAMQGIALSNKIEIIDPEIIREKYIFRLVELRMNKGMTSVIAQEKLKDNVVLGTMMLEQGIVDGLVSGAVHTTANTIRPALQLIKTAPGNSLVSSVFFMLLPEQVLLYGDCAINPNPTSEQLAEIAIQSSDSAAFFGIDPRVAMISYATGHSGFGDDVDKVREATYLAKKKRPDLIIDGPLQYDAAILSDVAVLKAPNSPVAGQATVFIFPDLNTGNTTYKAVQRSANVISIGPMLQGMQKAINDLSRGALVDDIVYTIALTAIQAKQAQR
ncbi:phosphate acetyltransferase [secondary endosymbiont of Heteropsylla cubana]|uniref:Phosphate acetyltransferase n=1 Tax=secondary endosymbiont of Heteropsylla cubana TaxID=134287 RepID=J3VUC2_9ENTR|nr:phosphate acetyltransferase [secondary endosymbiont of Heteropsylla cubana]AFP85731.1 phosphate acetyltransferase [secondary endosymbiont of Heteropsylla cubana]